MSENKSEHLEHTVAKYMRVAEEQEKKGIEKYGKPLDHLDLHYDWLQMAVEEQVDGFKYLVAEQRKRKFIAKKIRKLIYVGEMSEDDYQSIHFWLDALEGK